MFQVLTTQQICSQQFRNMSSLIQGAQCLPYEFLNPVYMDSCYIAEMWMAQTKSGQNSYGAVVNPSPYLWHKNNTRMFCVWIKLCTVGIFTTKNRACILNHSNLHSQTDAKKWYFVFTGIFCCQNFSLHPTVTKTPRN